MHNETSALEVLAAVHDPEIPVLNIVEMGILRNVRMDGDRLIVTITPTYSGCPAMETIEADIKTCLRKAGWSNFDVETVIAPPWTTDWITDEACRKLLEYGIAPPERGSLDKSGLTASPKTVRCPQCKSENTRLLSQFGSTACKALYKCNQCLEPFDYFKCI